MKRFFNKLKKIHSFFCSLNTVSEMMHFRTHVYTSILDAYLFFVVAINIKEVFNVNVGVKIVPTDIVFLTVLTDG